MPVIAGCPTSAAAQAALRQRNVIAHADSKILKDAVVRPNALLGRALPGSGGRLLGGSLQRGGQPWGGQQPRQRIIAETFGDTVMDVPEDEDDEDDNK